MDSEVYRKPEEGEVREIPIWMIVLGKFCDGHPVGGEGKFYITSQEIVALHEPMVSMDRDDVTKFLLAKGYKLVNHDGRVCWLMSEPEEEFQ